MTGRRGGQVRRAGRVTGHGSDAMDREEVTR